MKIIIRLSFVILLINSCASMQEKLKNVGKAPELNKMVLTAEQSNYEPIESVKPESISIITEDNSTQKNKNSLWKAGNRTFFRDQRARRVGDILKVSINIKDNANLNNKTEQARTNKANSKAPNILGVENILPKIIGKKFNPANLINLSQNDDLVGQGNISRNEAIQAQIAAIVSQILPNGNLVIRGHQEIRVNYELREVKVEGIVRPEDITSENVINSDLIAEARISYGGRGNISNLQQPRIGNQILDAISPF